MSTRIRDLASKRRYESRPRRRGGPAPAAGTSNIASASAPVTTFTAGSVQVWTDYAGPPGGNAKAYVGKRPRDSEERMPGWTALVCDEDENGGNDDEDGEEEVDELEDEDDIMDDVLVAEEDHPSKAKGDVYVPRKCYVDGFDLPC